MAKPKKIVNDESGQIVDLPLKLIIVMIIALVSTPAIWSEFVDYARAQTECELRNEISMLINSIKQVYAGGNDTALLVTVDFGDSSFVALLYVKIGDSYNGLNGSIIRYKFSGEDERKLLINVPSIPVTGPENKTLHLGPGHHSLTVVHRLTTHQNYVIVDAKH